MKTTRLFLICLAFAAISPCPLRAAEKPNIIFVLFDDMGYGQPQSYSAKSALRTPNLDKFATQGMRFTDAHTGAAVCTPTRYGVLTGRYDLQTDLSETKDVLAANSEVAARMTALMQRYIANGRSTVGPAQKNDFDLSITGESKGKQKKKKQQAEAAVKSSAERAAEMALAADASFD